MSNDPNLNPSHDFSAPVGEDRSNDYNVILGQLRANESKGRDLNKRNFVVLVDEGSTQQSFDLLGGSTTDLDRVYESSRWQTHPSTLSDLEPKATTVGNNTPITGEEIELTQQQNTSDTTPTTQNVEPDGSVLSVFPSSPIEFEPEKKLSPLFVFMAILVALCLTTVFAGFIVVFIYSEIGFGLICGGVSAAALFGFIIIGCVPTYYNKKNNEYKFKSSGTNSTQPTSEVSTVETL
jgi:hypothetical protein